MSPHGGSLNGKQGFVELSRVIGLGGSGFDDGVGLVAGGGGGCAGGGGGLVWLSGPDEFAVLVPLSQDTDEAGLSVKDSSYVLWCDARISPCGSDGQAYLVFGGMSCAYV